MRIDPNIATIRRRRFVKRFTAYVAGLAGLAIIEQDATAGIVHTNLLPDGITVRNGEFEIDLDLDGAVDFQLTHSVSFSSGEAGCRTFSNGTVFCTTGWRTYVFGAAMYGVGANKVVAVPGLNLAQNLSAGTRIHIEDAQRPTALLEHYFYTWSTNSSGRSTFRAGGGGEFGRGYMGFRFEISGSGSHAGWLEVESLGGSGAKVFGFAYENEPGVPIRAGDTGASDNIPGDTNGDGVVDLEDLNNVRNNFGATGEGILGDANGDDVVDLEDINAVRNSFGAGNPVPEPPSLVLLAAGAAGLALRRERAKRKRT